jgi:predicted nucleotidyltransferase
MVIKKENNKQDSYLINNTSIQILKLFLANPTKEYTILEISKIININYKLVYQQIKKFEKEKTIIVEKKGHSNICKINLEKSNEQYYFVERIRTNDFINKYPIIKVINDSIKKIENNYYTLIVFGSYVKENITKNSDLDLLFIIPQNDNIEKFKNLIYNKIKILNYNIDINVISENDFVTLRNNKNINVRNQVFDNHIILYGVENYYRLIS